jgi:hypothetical protein
MKVGYQRRVSATHRRYNWKSSIRHYKKTGKFRTVAGGSGHKAGERWGDEKNIDPNSSQRKYGKNSPSFDEGVWLSKQRRKEIKAKMQAMAKKMR